MRKNWRNNKYKSTVQTTKKMTNNIETFVVQNTYYSYRKKIRLRPAGKNQESEYVTDHMMSKSSSSLPLLVSSIRLSEMSPSVPAHRLPEST